MIPRLPPIPPPARAYQAFLDALRQSGFTGDIGDDEADRTVLATDNSIYRLVPQAVLYPRHTVAASLRDWQEVFADYGLRLELLEAGCCGMAGTYGHQVEYRDMSRHVFGLSWQNRLNKIKGNCPGANW